MKKYWLCLLLLANSLLSLAMPKDSLQIFALADTVKPTQLLANLSVQQVGTAQYNAVGLQTSLVKLSLVQEKNQRFIDFGFPKEGLIISKGINVDFNGSSTMRWRYNWSLDSNYQLLIATAQDSAGNFVLYSGYVWLAKEAKWKLLATCKINGRWDLLQSPALFKSSNQQKQWSQIQYQTTELQTQQQKGNWISLLKGEAKPPFLNMLNHVDSLVMANGDHRLIKLAMSSNQIEPLQQEGGVYFAEMKQGTGKQVLLTDTVSVFYKGYLLGNNAVFDETKNEPISFPLNRLIKGWQIALPKTKVGGKIKVVIPAGLAYSIRTRAAKIPPNSILVFEVEVVDAKEKLN
jgi:FKBP-type peptidyl-prolyl cis-trans isomerase FkpA